MARILGLAACAAVAGAQTCFLPDNTQGQDTFQGVNQAYLTCKTSAGVDQQVLCDCSTSTLASVAPCTYTWINPWIATVVRDKNKFCGAASSGSSASSLSGSQNSVPSFQGSSANSGSSNQNLTAPQKLFFVALAVCGCLLCVGLCGVAFLMSKKGKKTKPKTYEYDEEEQAQPDYEQEQYDQRYPGDYQQDQGMAPPQEEERWDMVGSPDVAPAQNQQVPLMGY